MTGHRDRTPEPVPVEAALADDPELELVHADAHAWLEAHPCECEALCTCDAPPEERSYIYRGIE